MPRRSFGTLAWRVFAVNAIVLALSGAGAVLLLAPGGRLIEEEAVLVAAGLAVMLVLNRVLLARELAPLERVARAMRGADPVAPGRRVAVPSRPAEARALAEAFNDMHERLEDERRGSTQRALGAQEAERLRISRELHDEAGQQLTALLLRLSAARRALGPAQAPALDEVHALARESLAIVRRVARDLRPEALDDLGLPSALAALGERIEDATGLDVELALSPVLPALSGEEELVVYRIAQEALTNVVRHAEAPAATLSLAPEPEGVVLRVEDGGRGFEVEEAAATGLQGMRERALLVGARLELDSRPGAGTRVRLVLPLGAPR